MINWALPPAWGRTIPSPCWYCRRPIPSTRPPSRRPRTGCATGSTFSDGSGPGEAGVCSNPSGRGRAGDRRRGPSAGGAGDARCLRPRSHGDGLRRLRPLPLRHRLGRVRPDGRGQARSAAGDGRRPPSSWRWSASCWCSRPRALPPCSNTASSHPSQPHRGRRTLL